MASQTDDAGLRHVPSSAGAGRRPLAEALGASIMTARGELPARYAQWWRADFDRRVNESLRPGVRVLDVGAGRHPTFAVADRPEGCRYVGLDLSAAELDAAPPGGYDHTVVSDIERRVPDLIGSFDVVISFLVLEHVADLKQAFENIRSYLVPGGRFVAIFSGKLSVFGLANRVFPQRLSLYLLKHLLHRPPGSVFPAYYNRCWAGALRSMLQPWTKAEVVPMWFGAGYFGFARPLQALYVGYEEWARLGNHANLAPYYLVDAVR